ncbi:MAG: ParB/RepB/Spo0J family partition protein [Chloroflexi bacterium]|nr:ParB/RepB/Spo0J family partition protein [Chloroflexota bacterium]
MTTDSNPHDKTPWQPRGEVDEQNLQELREDIRKFGMRPPPIDIERYLRDEETTTGIHDRIIAAWPHLGLVADRARQGDLHARKVVATTVLMGAIRSPLTLHDIRDISKW